MTLEELSLLREILDKVNLIERTLLEVKGFVGFREAAETTIAGGDVNVSITEDFAHEVQEAPQIPYWERVGNDPRIKLLQIGDTDITLTCFVDDAGTIGTWKKEDGTEGKVRNVMVCDGSDKIKLTLWNEQCDKYPMKNGMELVLDIWKVGIDKRVKTGDKRQLLLGPKGSIRPKGQERL